MTSSIIAYLIIEASFVAANNVYAVSTVWLWAVWTIIKMKDEYGTGLTYTGLARRIQARLDVYKPG